MILNIVKEFMVFNKFYFEKKDKNLVHTWDKI